MSLLPRWCLTGAILALRALDQAYPSNRSGAWGVGLPWSLFWGTSSRCRPNLDFSTDHFLHTAPPHSQPQPLMYGGSPPCGVHAPPCGPRLKVALWRCTRSASTILEATTQPPLEYCGAIVYHSRERPAWGLTLTERRARIT